MSETAERFAFLPAGHNKNQPTHTHTHNESFAFDEGMRNNATELFQEEKKACHSRRKDTLLDRPACVAKKFSILRPPPPGTVAVRRGVPCCPSGPALFPCALFPSRPSVRSCPVLLFVILTPIYLRAAGVFLQHFIFIACLRGARFVSLITAASHTAAHNGGFANPSRLLCPGVHVCVRVVSFCVRQRWQAQKRTPGGKLCRNC